MDSMVSHYRINVAKLKDGRGFHFFAAEVRDEGPAKDVYKELVARFPEYHVSVTYWQGSVKAVAWG